MQLKTWQKRSLRWTGYVALVLVVFLSAAWATFDADRLRDKAVSFLNKDYDVTIEKVDKGIIPGNFTAYGIVFKTRPKKPGEKPTIIVVDQIDGNVGLLPLLIGRVSVDIDAVLGTGTIEGDLSFSSSSIDVDLATEQLDVASVPGLSEVLFAGLPAGGGLNLSIDVSIGKGAKGISLAAANGTLSLSCPMCSAGPGKIVPKLQAGRRSNAFAKEGVTLPKLNLGDNTIEFVVTDGRAEIKNFEAVSTDGELYGEGYVDFKVPFATSDIQMCLKFKFSEKSKKKNAKLEAMERGMERARRQDGYIGMRMSGPFSRPKRIGSRSCQPGETPADIKRKRDRARRAQKKERDAERKAQREERKAEREAAKLKTTPATEGGDGENGSGMNPTNDGSGAAVPSGDVTARPITVDDARGNRGQNTPPSPRTSGPQLGARPDDVQPGEPEEEGEDGEEDGEEQGGEEEDGEEQDGDQQDGDQGEEQE